MFSHYQLMHVRGNLLQIPAVTIDKTVKAHNLSLSCDRILLKWHKKTPRSSLKTFLKATHQHGGFEMARYASQPTLNIESRNPFTPFSALFPFRPGTSLASSARLAGLNPNPAANIRAVAQPKATVEGLQAAAQPAAGGSLAFWD
jgi:hypothetical protein